MAPLLLSLLLTSLTIVGVAAPAPRQQPDSPGLLPALRAGGYVLLFRHALTDQSQADTDRRTLENCQTQRNLSDAGRAQAVTLGQGIRAQGIPLGRILASPYCRTLETARLAFGDAEPSPDLTSEDPDEGAEGRARMTAALKGLLGMVPDPGTNTVLVTHNLNIGDATELDIDEGEAIVVLPDGAGGFSVVTRVLAGGWASLPDH